MTPVTLNYYNDFHFVYDSRLIKQSQRKFMK